MIRIQKDFNVPPKGLLSKSCQEQQKKALAEKAKHNASTHHYRGCTIDALRELYNYKCGYCETPESAGSVLRVDHYRPKAGVTDAPTHEGYYWLAYEWSNLVLCCEKCNGRKLHNFPLENEANRVLTPTLGVEGLPTNTSCRVDGLVLRQEQPLLLNPEIDDPDQHLRFLPNGLIVAKTKRGEKSIELYFLLRDKLITDRKNMTDDIVEDLKKHLLKYLKQEIDQDTYRYVTQDVYEKATTKRHAKKAYSRLVNALFEDFENFVVVKFPEGQKPHVRRSFELFQQGKLWSASQKN